MFNGTKKIFSWVNSKDYSIGDSEKKYITTKSGKHSYTKNENPTYLKSELASMENEIDKSNEQCEGSNMKDAEGLENAEENFSRDVEASKNDEGSSEVIADDRNNIKQEEKIDDDECKSNFPVNSGKNEVFDFLNFWNEFMEFFGESSKSTEDTGENDKSNPSKTGDVPFNASLTEDDTKTNKNKSPSRSLNLERTLDWSQDPSKLKHPALGRHGHIGQLYDARTNKYFPEKFFTSDVEPSKFISVEDLGDEEVKVGNNDQLSDRFQLLDVKADQQLSILGLPVSLSGHGKYLLHEKKSYKSREAALLYRYSSKMEKLITPTQNVESFIDPNIFSYSKYTHVLVGIVWGAICIVTLEQTYENENKKEDVKISLINKLNRMGAFIKPQMTDHRSESYEETTNSTLSPTLQMYTDISTRQSVNNIDMACHFILQVPERIENEKQGYGVPLTYILLSLSKFAHFFKPDIHSSSRMLSSINETCITPVVRFFEDLCVLRQKLYDFEKDYLKDECYLSDKNLQEIKIFQENIKCIEMEVKSDLNEIIPQIRHGKANATDLVKMIEKFRNPNSVLTKLEKCMKELKEKLNEDIEIIKYYKSHNIIFLRKNENLDHFVARTGDHDLYILYTSNKLFQTNVSLGKKVFDFFTSMADNSDKNCQFILADLDVNSSMFYQDDLKIHHYKNGRIISKDVFADKENKRLTNFARILSVTNISYKPIQRSVLKLTCPGSVNGCCGDDPLIWHCFTCKEVLEYGFDQHLYCHCGNGSIFSFEFKCRSVNHGNKYMPFSRRLISSLDQLQPLEEMNILILGQTGVGKSTWINAIANYFQYETVEEARRGGVICAIPTSFSVNYKLNGKIMIQTVKIGDTDDNEITDVGQSATKGPKTYNFVHKNHAIRLIDTPGIGDTKGIEKDKENMSKILDHIGFLKEIHGICILLKPNETRITPLFRFCISELLTHLHKSASKNIIFCFTHSRSTFYSAGDSVSVLDNLLETLELKEMISLENKTMFCLDNEAYRFLCSLKYPKITWTDQDKKAYEASWGTSVKETKRLFECIQKLEPHKVADTTTLCDARKKILNLLKPLAEITQLIQSNRAAIENENRKIRENQESLDKLAAKLYMPHITLEPKTLPYPMMVCASPKCISYTKLEKSSLKDPEYPQVCHDHCSLSNVTPDTWPNEALKECHIFNYDLPDREKCYKCGCEWHRHMYLTYIQNRIETQEVNPTIQEEMNSKKDAAAKIEEHKLQLESKIQEYQKEQNRITEICLEFASFLRNNSIAPYNDAFGDYLKYLIKEEKEHTNKTEVDYNIIQNMEEMMKDYEKQVEIIKESEKNKGSKIVTVHDIANLQQELYNLKLTGEQINKSMEVSMASNSIAQRYAEQPLPIRASIKKEM